MKRALFVVFVSLGMAVNASQLPSGFVEQLLAQNLDPTDLVLAPDGRIFITIKSGKIFIVENGVLSQTVFLDIPVDNFNERGLGHMVLDPDFEVNHYYYVYYTVKDANHNRVSRFTANGDFTLPGSELILLDLDVLSGTIHNAGDMGFGLDGKLYISVGDGADAGNAQSFGNLLGKVLRLNPDGTAPSDNPFFNTPGVNGKNKAIWALGFRNPFSLDIQRGMGKVFVSDVGQSTWEEVNDVQAGKNYGWPLIEGARTSETPPANYKDPLYSYIHGGGDYQGCAIVGAAFYNPATNQFPNQYVGKYFFADYCNGYIHYVDPFTGSVQPFATNINRPVAIIVTPDGTLYYIARAGIGGGSESDNTSTDDGTLWKVTYSGSGTPVISAQPEDALAAVGDDVNFIFSASGAQPLSYQWLVDGIPIVGAISPGFTFNNAQLSDDGKKFSCTVSNSLGSVTTQDATLAMTSDTRPVPQLTVTLPSGAVLYQGGQTLQFSGSANDNEDGDLPPSSLTWKIDFHHDQHIHPGLQPTSGITSGSFDIPRVGETDDEVWYRVILTATDSQGLSGSAYQDVFPQKAKIILKTMPPNLVLNLDGQPIQTPDTVVTVVGITRTLAAPSLQAHPDTLYLFSDWTQSGLDQLFTFNAPAADTAFTAAYTVVPQGNGNGLVGFYYNTLDQNTTEQHSFEGNPSLTRIDPQINFDWGGGSPDANFIDDDFFTVHWVGEVLPQFSEMYKFYLTGDDGIRLWVNEVQLINKWIPQGPTEWSGSILLTAGQKYPIKVEFFEDAGGAVAKLKWSTSRLPKEIIPQSQLFTNTVTAIQELFSKKMASIFPSPADDQIIVQWATPPSEGDYMIIDLMGRKLLEGSFPADQRESKVDIKALTSGFFILRTSRLAIPFVKK